jgi:hypothetical protein
MQLIEKIYVAGYNRGKFKESERIKNIFFDENGYLKK